MNFEDAASEGLKRREGHVFGNWKKAASYHLVAESLAKRSHAVMWKAELISDEPGC